MNLQSTTIKSNIWSLLFASTLYLDVILVCWVPSVLRSPTLHDGGCDGDCVRTICTMLCRLRSLQSTIFADYVSTVVQIFMPQFAHILQVNIENSLSSGCFAQKCIIIQLDENAEM